MQTYKRVKIAPYLLIGGLAALGLSGCMPGLPNGLMNKTAPVAGKARTGGSAVVPNTAPLSAIDAQALPNADGSNVAALAAEAAKKIEDGPAAGQQNMTGSSLTSTAVAAEDGMGTSLSDENDFEAVSNRQSIESDAERLARNSASYQVIEPGALPTRGVTKGVNIVEYALSSDNMLGSPVYSRFPIGGQSRFLRNCDKYPSSDMAQIAFLERGGPKRDALGLDPDGDGFACYWDPAPFRKAVSN
jgi:hypothetical protein